MPASTSANSLNSLMSPLPNHVAPGIISNLLSFGGNLMFNLESTALSLQMVGTENPNALRFIEAYGASGQPSFSLFSNPINVGWWTVVAAMILGRVWLKND